MEEPAAEQASSRGQGFTHPSSALEDSKDTGAGSAGPGRTASEDGKALPDERGSDNGLTQGENTTRDALSIRSNHSEKTYSGKEAVTTLTPKPAEGATTAGMSLVGMRPHHLGELQRAPAATTTPAPDAAKKQRAAPGLRRQPALKHLTFFTPPGFWPSCGDACKSRHIPKPKNHAIDYCDAQKSGYKNHYAYFVHGMLASKELQDQLGWELQFLDDPFHADLVVCAYSQINDFLNDKRRVRRQLVLGVETGDSAYVQTSLGTLSRHEVLAVVKHHSWRFRHERCKHPVKETILDALAQRKGDKDFGQGPLPLGKVAALLSAEGCRAIPEESSRKVHTIIPSWLTVQKGAWWVKHVKHPKPIAERPVDVSFVGAVVGDFRKEHREGLLKALKGIGKRHRDWTFHISSSKVNEYQYRDVLANTKLFVSPWGYGEWSGKDEETMLAGAVLLKPLASCMSHVMPMYKPGETCLDVRPDWRDLEVVIEEALSDTDRLQRIQQAALPILKQFFGYDKALQNAQAVSAFARLLSNATTIAAEEFAKPGRGNAHAMLKDRGEGI
uniref:Uncharacterized protein n=1 Tax=Alexandrium monilatum TaxID=311494 RepID=A0A7S4T0C4_9DINO